MGIVNQPLVEALNAVPWQMSLWRQKEKGATKLRVVTDALPGEENGVDVNDTPISFSPIRRKYGWRKVVNRVPVRVYPPEIHPEHDAFDDL
jgi:hypothetical protein